jgi:hypothetical protein
MRQTLTPRTRRPLGVQGFGVVDVREARAVAPWSRPALGLCALLGDMGTIHPLGWASDRPFRIVQVAAMPAPMQFAPSFLLMDLTFYWWQVANHRARHSCPLRENFGWSARPPTREPAPVSARGDKRGASRLQR